MKIIDILKKIEDTKLYIEIKETETGASRGIFTKNDALLVHNNDLKNRNIKKINVKYYNGKRLLMLEVK